MPIKPVLTRDCMKKNNVLPEISKELPESRKQFPQTVYSRERPKSRVFDECAVLQDPYRWKEKIVRALPEQKYHIFQRIFKLPPPDPKPGPERDYSLYDYIPRSRKLRMSTSSLRTPSLDDSSLSFVGIGHFETRGLSFRLKTSAKPPPLPKEDESSDRSTRKTLNLKVPSAFIQFRRKCRLMKWKLAAMKALQASYALRGETDCDFDDMFVNPPTRPPTPPKDILQDIRSPYQKFLTKSNDEVASTWRAQEKSVPFEKLSLEEQAETAADMIAKEFIVWMREKAGFTESLLTESMLKEMFQIDLKDQTLRTLKVEMRELAAIPDTVAKFFEVPEMNERAALHRQIIWDSLYENMPERTVGFGTTHPKPHRKPKTNAKEKWFNTEVIPPDLQSGALLWQKLIGTPVLEKFCQWLLENPQYSKPNYLVSSGYLDEVAKKLKAKREQVFMSSHSPDEKKKTIKESEKLDKSEEKHAMEQKGATNGSKLPKSKERKLVNQVLSEEIE